MKEHIRVIDPSDDLHEAVDRLVEGLSPQERAAKLSEMFGRPLEDHEQALDADPMQPGIDAHETAMAARRKTVDTQKAAKAGTSNPCKPSR